jgi:hypothetical protein
VRVCVVGLFASYPRILIKHLAFTSFNLFLVLVLVLVLTLVVNQVIWNKVTFQTNKIQGGIYKWEKSWAAVFQVLTGEPIAPAKAPSRLSDYLAMKDIHLDLDRSGLSQDLCRQIFGNPAFASIPFALFTLEKKKEGELQMMKCVYHNFELNGLPQWIICVTKRNVFIGGPFSRSGNLCVLCVEFVELSLIVICVVFVLGLH